MPFVFSNQLEQFLEDHENERGRLRCPECGRYSMYNRNCTGDALWYCPNCDYSYTLDELIDMFIDARRI